MESQHDQVLRAALALPPDERAQLIDELSISLPQEYLDAVENSWKEVVRQRTREYDEGRVSAIPWDEVQARIAARIRASDADGQ